MSAVLIDCDFFPVGISTTAVNEYRRQLVVDVLF